MSLREGSLPREEGFWAVVARTLRQTPPRVRRRMVLLLGAGLFALLLPFWSVPAGGEPPEVAELLSILLGTLGGLLVSFAYVLHGVAEKGVGCGPGGLSFEPRVFHQMLLAVPTFGVAAGVLLGASAGMLVVRALHDRPILFAAVAVYLAIFVLAARSVTRTNRFLYRHAREQAEAASSAREQAAEARLAALAAQMNPHFLFNALNTVASLVRTSPETAETTVENLADVLRRTLDRSQGPLGTVGEEVEYLRAYLEVEKERWGDRLEVTWKIAPETRRLPLPPMTLQPLVENALKHGLGGRLEGGRLGISTELAGEALRLRVTDDGAGLPARWSEGTGLGNLRRRLDTLYGEAARLTVEAARPGTRAMVEVPVAAV
jgi:signal transduction histidine kinase